MERAEQLARVDARLAVAREDVRSLVQRRAELEGQSRRRGEFAFELARLRGTTQFAVERVLGLEAERDRLLTPDEPADRTFGEG